MRQLGPTNAWLEFFLEKPVGRGLAYFCEESLHGVFLSSNVAILLLTILGVQAFAGSAEIFGHASDCLVFLFKCLPLLQLLEKRTHVIYLITHPETHSLTVSQKHQGMTVSRIHKWTNYSLLRVYFILESSQTAITEGLENVKVIVFKKCQRKMMTGWWNRTISAGPINWPTAGLSEKTRAEAYFWGHILKPKFRSYNKIKQAKHHRFQMKLVLVVCSCSSLFLFVEWLCLLPLKAQFPLLLLLLSRFSCVRLCATP